MSYGRVGLLEGIYNVKSSIAAIIPHFTVTIGIFTDNSTKVSSEVQTVGILQVKCTLSEVILETPPHSRRISKASAWGQQKSWFNRGRTFGAR